MRGHPFAGIPKTWILLACIGLLALNLRAPFVAVPPLVDIMQTDLGFSPVALGLLTSIPVLCFALAAPLASMVAKGCGAEFAVSATILGVLVGVVVRSAGGPTLVLAGTVIIGLAITIGNIAAPLIIRRDFPPARQGTAMGIYTAALNVGSFLASIIMAPLAELAGWQVALASVGLLAVAAIVCWILAVGLRPAFVPAATVVPAGQGGGAGKGSGWTTAGLTTAFAAQAFSYYAVTAWLPSYLNDELAMSASEAGAASSLFQVFAIVGALGVPFAAKYFSTVSVAIAVGVLWTAVPAGLLVAHELWWLWSVSGGVAQGAAITLVFIAIIKLAGDQVAAGRMSATVQGIGYCFGAVAPPLVGFVRDISGSWTPALLVVLASVLAYFVSSALSVRRVPKGR